MTRGSIMPSSRCRSRSTRMDRVAQAVATRDPVHGFGCEARRCALSKRSAPGLDRAGNAANAATVVNVRFDRW